MENIMEVGRCKMYNIPFSAHGWCPPSAVRPWLMAGSWVEIQIWTLPSNEDTEAAAAAAVSPARTRHCMQTRTRANGEPPTPPDLNFNQTWIINWSAVLFSTTSIHLHYTTALLTRGIQEEGSARFIFNCADMRLFNFHDFKLWIMWILWSSVPGTGVCTAFCLN